MYSFENSEISQVKEFECLSKESVKYAKVDKLKRYKTVLGQNLRGTRCLEGGENELLDTEDNLNLKLKVLNDIESIDFFY